jgi:hypothetical protein
MLYKLVQTYKQICKVLRWIPIIWKDRDYDGTFITEILISKLESQRDYFSSKNCDTDHCKHVHEQITTAINMLNTTKDSWDLYDEPVYNLITEKWGESEFEPNGDDTYTLVRSGVKTTLDEQLCAEEFKKLTKEATTKYKKDKVNAYTFIAKNIDDWWY